jgi:3-oxoacyl-[acyl-carrier protein] reductase
MLKNKKALITGSSRGIGKAIAKKFAEHEAFVGINYLSNDTQAKVTLNEINKKGGNAILLKGDVSDQEDVKRIVKKFTDKTKHIDILVNNAGIYPRHSFKNLDKTTWDKIIQVNLTSSYLLCKEVIPYMKSGGKIIFISSQLAFKGSTHGADYASTKAGMLGLMRSLALELSDKKICVNAVAPGTIDTDLLINYTEEMKRKRAQEIPLKRLGTPDDIANTCLFLASDLSDYITGETINVNGGLYIH